MVYLSPCCQQEENVFRIQILSGPGGGVEELVLRARTLEEKEDWLAGLTTVQAQEEVPCLPEGETESIREESVKRETELVSEKSTNGLDSTPQVLALPEYKGTQVFQWLGELLGSFNGEWVSSHQISI